MLGPRYIYTLYVEHAKELGIEYVSFEEFMKEPEEQNGEDDYEGEPFSMTQEFRDMYEARQKELKNERQIELEF